MVGLTSWPSSASNALLGSTPRHKGKQPMSAHRLPPACSTLGNAGEYSLAKFASECPAPPACRQHAWQCWRVLLGKDRQCVQKACPRKSSSWHSHPWLASWLPLPCKQVWSASLRTWSTRAALHRPNRTLPQPSWPKARKASPAPGSSLRAQAGVGPHTGTPPAARLCPLGGGAPVIPSLGLGHRVAPRSGA